VDSLFPSDIPETDGKLIAEVAAQFGVGLAVVTEAYRVLLSFRGSDAPSPLGDGIPFFFYFTAQPNLLKKWMALNERIRTALLAKLYPQLPSSPDVGVAPEGGAPQ
jgi:hypothetical protein